ncbi:TetR/AcrR family transcriptional regulator C-terminal ligand-binding domain-containing protein [Nocardia sp. NBC_01499]|uniref:TetR-like C-terminal domain-containing protein n=1 Tax=Nocardia sp. NBC_01499 TaxID=2903597 RepID=UPI00386B4D7A
METQALNTTESRQPLTAAATSSPAAGRAVSARGEIPDGTNPAEMIKTLVAPIYFRVLITGEPVDDNAADTAAALTLTAARARLFTDD